MGRYLEIADRALSEITESQSLTESEVKDDSPTQCERSELSELSPDDKFRPNRSGSPLVSVDKRSRELRESSDELRRAAGDDWSAVRTDPAGLVAFADLLAIVQIRESGRVPDTYTAITNCQTCASIVPIFEGCPPKVGACVWCMSGLTAPAILRD